MSDPDTTLIPALLVGENRLTSCVSVECVADILGLTYEKLSGLIYPNIERQYRSFTIPKKSGEERTINAPKKALKYLQRKLADRIGELYVPRFSAHGFISGRSIVSNARKHVGKSFVFNIDLNDYFGSIHFGRVRNLFMAAPFNIPYDPATVIAHICCYQGRLPQGAPTSPIISNMISFKMDGQLHALARQYRCHYTRYADDITFSFSSSKRKIPKAIVLFNDEGDAVEGHKLKSIIEANGFSINESKVRLASKHQRQEVTGLTVNRKINVKRSYVRQTHAMLHSWIRHGEEDSEKHYLEKYRGNRLLRRQEIKAKNQCGKLFSEIVAGRVNYIRMVRGEEDLVFRKLAYKLSVARGQPNGDYLKSKEERICDSVFIVDNDIDSSQGTAFLLSDIGLVTNQHVVENIDNSNCEVLEIYRHDEVGTKRAVDFLKSKKSIDLAIFIPSGDFSNILPLTVGDDSKLMVGDTVTVIGFPDHSEDTTPYINKGKIVQRKKLFNQYIWLVDVPVIHGNSGGPVLNNDFEVIGVATKGSEKHDQSKFGGFIPISRLVDFANEGAGS